jgi:type IV pilus assembly protein PilO
MAPPTQKPAPGTNKPPQAQNFASQPTAAKALIGVLLVGAIGALYYVLVHSPVEDELAAAEQTHRQLETNRDAANARQAEFLRVMGEIAAREGLDRVNMRVLPEQAEMASFLQDLNRLAETSGLSIRTVEPRPEEQAEHFVKLPVALRVSGRYHQLARFFYNVSRLERAISMENIKLGDPALVGEDVVLDVQVMATTYRRPPAESDATGTAQTAGT